MEERDRKGLRGNVPGIPTYYVGCRSIISSINSCAAARRTVDGDGSDITPGPGDCNVGHTIRLTRNKVGHAEIQAARQEVVVDDGQDRIRQSRLSLAGDVRQFQDDRMVRLITAVIDNRNREALGEFGRSKV